MDLAKTGGSRLMRSKLTHLPKPVVDTLLAFYYRKRFYELLRAVLQGLLCFAAVALIATHVDRLLFLSTAERFWLSVITLGATLLVTLIELGLFLRRQRSVTHVAYELERMLPRSAAERLVTLNDVLTRENNATPGISRSAEHAVLVAQLTRETVALCEETPHAGRLVRDRRLKIRTVLLGLLALIWAGLMTAPAYQFPLMLERLVFPLRNLAKPSFIKLAVSPESAIIGRGGEVVLQVRVDGSIPRLLQAPMRWLGTDSSRCLLATATGQITRLDVGPSARPMSRVQSKLFVTSRSDLQESFSYRVRCGDAQTDIRLVRVITQPRATHVYVTMDPPAYTGLKTLRFDELRDPVPSFLNSKLRICFGADQAPLKSVRLVNTRDSSTVAELTADPATGSYTYEFTYTLDAPKEIELVLVNELGFENIERVRIAFALREDQAPSVRMEYPVGEVSAVPGELVPIQLELADDLGLLEGAICYQLNASRNPDASVREIPLPVEEKKLAQTLSTALDIAKTDAGPGDELLLWVRVRDTGRNDEHSPGVRVLITAFGGNENEHRRLVALRLTGQLLASLMISAGTPPGLQFNESAAEPALNTAASLGLVLPPQPGLHHLLNFLEREQFFTDGTAAANEVRMLYGLLAAQINPADGRRSAPAEQKTALQQLGTGILPGLMRDRLARDLIRRTINLRTETLASTREAESRQKTRAAFERRMDLLRDAIDTTGEDLAALARLSPRQLKLDEVLNVKRQISLACLDLKRDSAKPLATGKALAGLIDNWIALLLPAIPEWQEQRRAACADLRTGYEATRNAMDRAARASPPSAAALSWLSADARMIERTPFLGLAERLPSTTPGAAASNAAAQVALACEAALLSRMTLQTEYAAWTATPRITPAERRLAAALQSLDQAGPAAERAAAIEHLRAFRMDDESAAGNRTAAAPLDALGLTTQLPGLTRATALTEAFDKTLEYLAKQVLDMQSDLARLNAGDENPDTMSAGAATLATIESGLARWEADCQGLSFRMHLDLSYGDPLREQTPRITAALPAVREVVSRYQAFVPPLMLKLKTRLQRRSSTENLSALSQDQAQLTQTIAAMGNKLNLTARQLRDETKANERESATMRETRLYYQTARQLAEATDPAAVAHAFFANNPAAATLVLDTRRTLLLDLRQSLHQANDLLRTENAASPAFVQHMMQALQGMTAFEQQMQRFAALDTEGAIRIAAANIRKRMEPLVQPGRDAVASLARDRLALDELQRAASQLDDQTAELVRRFSAPTPSGWWGGPAGVWDDAGRRDAENARRRTLAQFNRARREIVLGIDALATRRDHSAPPLPDEPLASALLNWRILHSSLGGGTRVVIPPPQGGSATNSLSVWLKNELEITKKVLQQTEGGLRPYQETTRTWLDSAEGMIR
jgi:hypothetical protein